MQASLRTVAALASTIGLAAAGLANADESAAPEPVFPAYSVPLGIAMESLPYPAPVRFLPLEIEGQTLRMAYMDVPAAGAPNGRTIVLLHGKNFAGFYWDGPIRLLTEAGYRVVVPDQIGFGKSAKPDIHYSFDLLVANTLALLDALKVGRVDLLGHSTGGAIAIRFARTHPERVEHLLLEDPIGLEDYRRYVAPQTTEALIQAELTQTQAGYRKFVQGYFVTWKADYERLVEPYARMMLSGEYPRYAKASALTYQMIYQQPVVYDLPFIRLPSLLIYGAADHAALGRQFVTPEVRQQMGNFPELARAAQQAMPGLKIVEIPDCGHIPHVEAPERFNRALLDFLATPPR